jgi:hypothetical protein
MRIRDAIQREGDWMARMVGVCVWALCFLGVGALGVGALSGCQPSEAKAARVDLLAPQQVTQGAELEIFGANFGDWDVYKNQVLIGDACADVLLWSPSRLVVVVPHGIGVGARDLDITTADGQRLGGTVSVSGPDKPRQPKLCAEFGGPVVTDDVSADVPVADFMDITDLSAPPEGAYVFAIIRDQLFAPPVSWGADIDAVVLHKPNGDLFYAAEVGEYFTNPDNPVNDPSAALGPPDAFPQYPDLSLCSADSDFVSLGGSGGALVVRFPVAIEVGDELEVLEVGGCATADGMTQEAEPYELWISPSTTNDFWVQVGAALGPQRFFISQTP